MKSLNGPRKSSTGKKSILLHDSGWKIIGPWWFLKHTNLSFFSNPLEREGIEIKILRNMKNDFFLCDRSLKIFSRGVETLCRYPQDLFTLKKNPENLIQGFQLDDPNLKDSSYFISFHSWIEFRHFFGKGLRGILFLQVIWVGSHSLFSSILRHWYYSNCDMSYNMSNDRQ